MGKHGPRTRFERALDRDVSNCKRPPDRWLTKWISHRHNDMSRMNGIVSMKTTHILLLTVFAAAIAAASPMLAREQATLPGGGALDTLPLGTYQCALPGDVAGAAYKVVESEQFQIEAASKYSNAGGSGIYLLRGDELTFTRGPKKGERYKRVGTNQVRKMDGQTETKLLCTRITDRP
jgi:hypothetical protein